MATQVFTTHSAEETSCARPLPRRNARSAQACAFRGDLGAGKTTLVKGIAEAFHAASAEEVTSPTFTLIHEYRGPEVNLYHIDLYRIDTPRELETLGLDDLIADNSILLIEWGEKFERFERERDVEIALVRVPSTTMNKSTNQREAQKTIQTTTGVSASSRPDPFIRPWDRHHSGF